MSKFQFIVIAIFIVAIIAGVIAFATYRNDSTSSALPPVTIWGTFPDEVFNRYVAEINNSQPVPIRVSYVYKSPDRFQPDFVSALARGVGPDAILIPADRILPEENKLTVIPYSAFSQRDFLDSFIQQAELYIRPDGIIAVPFTIDPLVMYWNRDAFNAAGLAAYPRYWDEFSDLNKSLTVKDQNGNVRKSAVAMGTMSNITNARELLGTLMLQAGNPITRRQTDGSVVSTLADNSQSSPLTAVAYFTKFADPANADYSWNRGMPNDKTYFLGGNLAVYFGLASEMSDIRAKNPNLIFDIAPIPQTRSGGKTAAYGRMYGFSIVRAATDANAAFQTISVLTSPSNISILNRSMYIPSVWNSQLQGSSDPYITNFNKAALVARGWLDADPLQSKRIFESMVNAIVGGQKSASNALRDASTEYDVLLGQVGQ